MYGLFLLGVSAALGIKKGIDDKITRENNRREYADYENNIYRDENFRWRDITTDEERYIITDIDTGHRLLKDLNGNTVKDLTIYYNNKAIEKYKLENPDCTYYPHGNLRSKEYVRKDRNYEEEVVVIKPLIKYYDCFVDKSNGKIVGPVVGKEKIGVKSARKFFYEMYKTNAMNGFID